MLSLLIWAAVLLACYGTGAAVLSRLRAEPESWAEELPFAIALGMGLLSYLVLTAGLLGQLKAWIGIALICLVAALGWRQLARLGREGVRALGRSKRWRWQWVALPLLLLFLAAGAFTLIGALAPATDGDYDGLVYHLALPKVYLRDGRIHPIPWLSHSNFPFNLEMLYLLGLLLRDQTLAKLFHLGCGWLTVLAIFAFGRRAWGARAGSLGSAIYAAIPLVIWEMMSAYNELAFALYAFLAMLALARWYEGKTTGKAGWLWVAAIMCGLALGTKMLAGAALIFALMALVWTCARTKGERPPAARIAVFAVIALAVASPWYIKSYLYTGNPVYPFFYSLFDGRWWSADRARAYTEAQKAFGLGAGPAAFLALPWNLTMNTRWFFDLPQQLRPVNALVWVFGPLLLALLPTLLVTGPVGARGRLALWFALVYTAIWFLMSQNGRYLIPILPGLCACSGLAADRLMGRRAVLTAVALVALLLGLGSGLYVGFDLASPAAPVALGLQSQSDYLSANSRLYPMLEAISRATPGNARILVLGDEPRLFYLDRDYLLGSHAQIWAEQDLKSPDALLAAWHRMGITHLLIHVSTLRDVAAGRGAMERDIAGLEAAGEIRPLGLYGTLSLWEIADRGKAS